MCGVCAYTLLLEWSSMKSGKSNLDKRNSVFFKSGVVNKSGWGSKGHLEGLECQLQGHPASCHDISS